MPKSERSPRTESLMRNGLDRGHSGFGFRVYFGFREAMAKVALLWYSHALFPLTPALSLREREHHGQRIRQPGPLGVVAARSLVLPLPEGEGRGEAERALETADSGSFAIGSRHSVFGFCDH